MTWRSWLISLFGLALLAVPACDPGCVEANEFGGPAIVVQANPRGTDGVGGTYPVPDDIDAPYSQVSGQTAEWHDTGLISNGEEFVITITGGWLPWGESLNESDINRYILNSPTSGTNTPVIPKCKICAKKSPIPPGTTTAAVTNCICLKGQTPTTEIDPATGAPAVDVHGNAYDCTVTDNMNNPDRCTCTTQDKAGNSVAATDYGVYHILLNYFKKHPNGNGADFYQAPAPGVRYNTPPEAIKSPDDQSICKLTGGMGLYIGLFGQNGGTVPKRIYHLFSEERTCSIAVLSNDESKCVDSAGQDKSIYTFRSRGIGGSTCGGKIFMKDDGTLDNSGITNTDTTDDLYHSANESIKLIISDRYYDDNKGAYNVKFLKGVGTVGDLGIVEKLVRMVEDLLLGNIDPATNQREGGLVRFLYNAIVQDSGFRMFVDLALILYVTFYGIATLAGLAAFNKKEIMTRSLKIALVIFFTSATSWGMYNKIVVGFFKDGMDSVISMMMSLSDATAQRSTIVAPATNSSGTPCTTTVTSAGAASATHQAGAGSGYQDISPNVSQGERFYYMDAMIKNAFSPATTKKIWGLFFGTPFGILWIPLIYGLIFLLLYVSIVAASVYIVSVMKMIFALALGPIFISLVLFGQTKSMFEKWLAFIAARSLEIIILFTLLYTMLSLINAYFFDQLLAYKACTRNFNLIVANIPVYMAPIDLNRSFVDWLSLIFIILVLILLTIYFIGIVPNIAGKLISVKAGLDGKGQEGGGANLSGFKMGGDIVTELSQKGLGVAGGAAGLAGRGLIESGATDFVNKGLAKIPITGPRDFLRNRKIDSAIKEATATAQAKGFKGAALDKKVRELAYASLQKEMNNKKSANSSAFGLGLTMDAIGQRLDSKLVKEPLKDFLKNKAAELKNQQDPSKIPLGKDMKRALQAAAREWAKQNLAGGSGAVKDLLKDRDIKRLMKTEGALSSTEAAQAFAHNKQQQQRYMAYLVQREFAEKQKAKDAADSFGRSTGRSLTTAARSLLRTSHDNPRQMQESFARKIMYEERERTFGQMVAREALGFDPAKGLNMMSRVNVLDTIGTRFERQTQEMKLDALKEYLASGQDAKERKEIEDRYNAKIAAADSDGRKESLEKERDKQLKRKDDETDFIKNQVKELEAAGVKRDAGAPGYGAEVGTKALAIPDEPAVTPVPTVDHSEVQLQTGQGAAAALLPSAGASAANMAETASEIGDITLAGRGNKGIAAAGLSGDGIFDALPGATGDRGADQDETELTVAQKRQAQIAALSAIKPKIDEFNLKIQARQEKIDAIQKKIDNPDETTDYASLKAEKSRLEGEQGIEKGAMKGLQDELDKL